MVAQPTRAENAINKMILIFKLPILRFNVDVSIAASPSISMQ